jgi:CHAT domain-containing protein
MKVYRNGKRAIARNKTGPRNLVLLTCLFVLSFIAATVVPAIAGRLESNAPLPVEIVERSPASPTLLQTGKQYYEAGQYSEAANLWQQAARAYADRGERFNQVQALNYLSFAYQKLGQWSEARAAIDTSIELLQGSVERESRGVALLAQALNARGSLQLASGKTEAALETWQQAEAAYDRAGDESGKLGSRINQAQALQALGQYRRSKTLLEQLAEELRARPDSLLKADGLRSLGTALQTIGDLLQSKAILEESWAISQQLGERSDTAATLLSIGNIARDLEQNDVAKAYYQEAAKQTTTAIARAQIRLNLLSLLVTLEERSEARALIPSLESDLSSLAPSRASIYARVNLAESWIGMEKGESAMRNGQSIARLLAAGVQQAREIRDRRAEAYALYQLGKLYDLTGQEQEAKNLTEQALQIAQNIDAADIAARAAAELGSILKQQKNFDSAIAAYQTAYNNLQSLRSDLVAINPDVQFTFKESVEPIYRELVSLLLQPPSVSPDLKGVGEVSQSNLKQAREVIEALQLAELDNFFRDACLDVKPAQIDEIDTQAAVIYPILLRDRLEVILSLPGQPLRNYATPLPAAQVEAIVGQARSSLYLGYSSQERLRLSEQIYNWLIRPAEDDLASSKIATLVFVLDGPLRNLPMAALYDGQQYLLEKYSVAISSGLQLFPQGLETQHLNILTAGITEARQGFSALPGVQEEIAEIISEVQSAVLLDREFTRQAFQEKINNQSFRVVHLATHGQFSSNPEDTFLLTWDNKLSIQDFDLLFQKRRVGLLQPIELLVLSACQTASGDNRATLGLAGLALRSGAYSTLASLWSVNDQSTAALMSEFYRQLVQPNRPISKAEALRQAQLALRTNPLYDHPYFWAAFVLVGNWL